MAEKLCTLRTKGGGGGRYTETSLWTNSSPSSAFAAQTVTLSDSISNYKYLAIYYKYAGTTDGVNDPMSVIVPVDKFKTSLKNNSTRHNILVLGVETNGNAGWTRNVFYASDTTIEFDTGYRQNAASSSGDICVPTEILGLNELDHAKGFDETTLWTNSAPTSSFAAQTVTLSDNLSNYDYFKIKFRLSTSNASSAMVMDSVSDFLTNYSNTSSTWRGTIFYTTSTVHMIRRFRNNNSSGSEIRFMGTMLCTISDHTWTDSTNLDYLIPTEIIGCKFR